MLIQLMARRHVMQLSHYSLFTGHPASERNKSKCVRSKFTKHNICGNKFES